MLIKDLQTIGFSRNIAAVYLALVEHGGQARAGEIIKKTNLHRNIVYVCLDKLIAKKLVNKVEERGVSIFRTLEPARLMNEVKEKEQLVGNIIEELEVLKKHPSTQEVIVYEGLEGFREYNILSMKRLEEGGTLYILGSFGDRWYEFMGEKAYKEYENIQFSKNIAWKVINYTASKKDDELHNKRPDLCQIKYIPQNYKNPSNMHIWGDRIALQISTNPISVIEIRNSALSEVYLNYFNLLWNQEAQTFRGWKELDRVIRYNLEPGYTHDVFGANYGEGDVKSAKHIMDFFVDYMNTTASLKPKRRLIFYENHRKEAVQEINQTNPVSRANIQLRYLPEMYYTPMQTHVFKDKVILIFFFEEPTATLYTNPKIVDAYRKQFELLWGLAK